MPNRPARPFSNFLTIAIIATLFFLMGMDEPRSAFAQVQLARPSGDVILEVTGKIEQTNRNGRAVFDRQMLEKIGMTTVRTSTPWTDGVLEFEGVLLRDLLSHCGAIGETIHAIAWNDYVMDIPVDDAMDYAVLLALKADGTPFSARDKGPIWIIYPLDDHRELRGRLTERKMVWQLKELHVR
ncbi:MAG: molybdopterin-dependent oxidoreductase [Pseudomonadota bacterium]